MGLDEPQRSAYAWNAAAIEGIVTSAFSAAPGFAGMEDVAKAAIKGIGKEAAGRTIKRIGSEVSEELLIQVGQNVNRMAYHFDPTKSTSEQLREGTLDVVVQTLLTMGVMEGGLRAVRGRDKQENTPTTDTPATPQLSPELPTSVPVGTPPQTQPTDKLPLDKSSLLTPDGAAKLFDINPEGVSRYIAKESPSRRDAAELLGTTENDADYVRAGIAKTDRLALRDLLMQRSTMPESPALEDRKATRKAMMATGIPESDPAFQAIVNFKESNRLDAPVSGTMRAVSGLETVKGIELPEAKTIMREIGDIPLIQKKLPPNLRGYFMPVEGEEHVAISKKLGADVDQASKTIWHEIGHVIDYLGEKIVTARGNLLGHMFGLSKYTREVFGTDLPITSQSAYDRAAVDEQAQRKALFAVRAMNIPGVSDLIDVHGEVFDPAKNMPAIEATTEYQNAFYDHQVKMQDAWFGSRQKFQESDVYREGLKLSQLWRPFNPDTDPASYVAYRKHPNEVQADVTGIILNSPGIVAEHAPTLWNAWTEGMSAKPEALKAYVKLQTILTGEPSKLAELRSENSAAMSARGGQTILDTHDAALRDKESTWSRMSSLMADLNTAFHNKAGSAILDATKYTGEARKAAMHVLDKIHDLRVEMMNVAKKTDDIMIKPLKADDFTPADIDEVLKMRRISGEDIPYDETSKRFGEIKATQFNPDLFTTQEAKKQLEALKERFGAEKWGRLEAAIKKWSDEVIMPVARKLHDNGGMSDAAWEEVQRAGDTYSTFLSTYWYAQNAGYVDPGIKARTGNMGDVISPLLGTTMKIAGMARYAQLLEIRNTIMAGLPDVETVEGDAMPRQKPKDVNSKWYQIRRDDISTWHAVPRHVAELLEHQENESLQRVANSVSSTVGKILTPLYITKNPAWAIAQGFMDTLRTAINAPTVVATARKAKMKALVEAGMSRTDALEHTKDMHVPVIWNFWHENSILSFKNLSEAFRFGREYAGKDNLSDKSWEMIEKRFIDAPHDLVAQQVGLRDMEAQAFAETEELVLARLGGRRFNRPSDSGALMKGVLKLWDGLEALGNFSMGATKHLGARPIRQALGDTDEAAYNVRKYVATPDLKQKGTWTNLANSMFMYFKPSINGLMADTGLIFNKETGPEYIKNWAATTLPFITIGIAAGAGYLGEEWKALWEMIPEYFRKNYYVIPMFTTLDDGQEKAAWVMVKPDPMSRTLKAFVDAVYAVGIENKEPSIEKDLNDLVNRLWEGTPLSSISTPLSMANAWRQYASGVNPIDPHFGGNIVQNDPWLAGGTERFRGMVHWSARQFGVASTLAMPVLDPLLRPTSQASGYSTVEGITQGFPITSRFFRVSNRGLSEKTQAAIEMEKEFDARIRVSFDADTKWLGNQRWMLTTLKPSQQHELSTEEHQKLALYNHWYNTAYVPLRKYYEAAYNKGDEQEQARLLGVLKEQSAAMRETVTKGVNLPDYFLPRVLLDLTDTTIDEQNAKRRRSGLTPQTETLAEVASRQHLAALTLAKEMPPQTALQFLRLGHIESMSGDELEKINRRFKLGVVSRGMVPSKDMAYREELEAAVIQSGYRPPIADNGRLTAYGRRVARLRKMLAE